MNRSLKSRKTEEGDNEALTSLNYIEYINSDTVFFHTQKSVLPISVHQHCL